MTGNYLSYRTNLHRYVFDKLFKILEDYVDFLFDTHDYQSLYSSLADIINSYEDNYENPPYDMRLLIATIRNEAKVLSDIWNGVHNSKLQFVEIPALEPSCLKPFCDVLNHFYRMIYQIITNKSDDASKENPNLRKELHDAIEKAIQEQSMPRGGYINRDIFVGWLLDDIISAVNIKFEDNPAIKDSILSLTAIVEDCRRQIEGRKRHETY